jgi:hypothetical protein
LREGHSHHEFRWLRRDVARPTSREAEVDSRGLELKQGREDWNAHFIFKDGIFQAFWHAAGVPFWKLPAATARATSWTYKDGVMQNERAMYLCIVRSLRILPVS